MNTPSLDTPRRTSIAHLKVHRTATGPTLNPVSHDTTKKVEIDINAVFGRLNKLIVACGPKPNKNDLAIALITACIGEGINTEQKIIGVLARLGLNPKHAAMMLKEHGTDRWQRGPDRSYRLLD
jgi:hypothetical protein